VHCCGGLAIELLIGGSHAADGAELIMGVGHFVAPKTIEVQLNDGGTRVLMGARVFLNLGTHATIMNISRGSA
jgi:pyruvate/2-oxoglutarate dehydrogenase complex dihydrolipoamide dehydrogenase (E3) component